jgi:alpha-L-fucosidase
VPIFEERLTDLGKFVNTHNEAIFGTKPWIFQTDFGDIWYTSRLRNSRGFSSQRIFNPQQVQNTIIYAWVLTWPEDGHVKLSSVRPTSKVTFGTTSTLIAKKFLRIRVLHIRKPMSTKNQPIWRIFDPGMGQKPILGTMFNGGTRAGVAPNFLFSLH